jgi:hypothetical protein
MHCVPEISSGDEAKVEQQLQRFVTEVILPLVMRVSSVVIVEATTDCGLSAAVRRVLAPVLQRLGQQCPFALIGVTSAMVVSVRAALCTTIH